VQHHPIESRPNETCLGHRRNSGAFSAIPGPNRCDRQRRT